jgi:hypothetical protein
MSETLTVRIHGGTLGRSMDDDFYTIPRLILADELGNRFALFHN